MKKKKKGAGKGGRIFAVLIGIFILLWNANVIGLYILGDVTPAYDIKLTRFVSRDDTTVGTEYRFDISYHYRVDGKDYYGLNTGIRGPFYGPSYDRSVHYYPFAPKISSLFAESAFSIGMLLACGLGIALIFLGVVPNKRREKVAKNVEVAGPEVDFTSETPVTMAFLMEKTNGYDDELEEYYHNGWDKNDPSWQCKCGKWNEYNFCESCGRSKTGCS